jgi:hypothetical protein
MAHDIGLNHDPVAHESDVMSISVRNSPNDRSILARSRGLRPSLNERFILTRSSSSEHEQQLITEMAGSQSRFCLKLRDDEFRNPPQPWRAATESASLSPPAFIVTA